MIHVREEYQRWCLVGRYNKSGKLLWFACYDEDNAGDAMDRYPGRGNPETISAGLLPLGRAPLPELRYRVLRGNLIDGLDISQWTCPAEILKIHELTATFQVENPRRFFCARNQP